MKLDFLVTGTGRCGTVSMARLLSSLGIMCGHEVIFQNDGIRKAKMRLLGEISLTTSYCSSNDLLTKTPIDPWYEPMKTVADSSYMAAPFLKDKILKDTKIIHIVRNPIQVLSSFVLDVHFFEKKSNDPYQKFVTNILPEIWSFTTEIERTCFFLIEWNKMIEDHHQGQYLLHRIEDGCDYHLVKFIGVNHLLHNFQIEKMNSWKKRKKDLSLEDIPQGKLKKDFLDMIVKYRYLFDF